MKPLTLTQLRKAIDIIKTSKKFKDAARFHPQSWDLHVLELEKAMSFLTGEGNEMPTDPRLILVGLEYKW